MDEAPELTEEEEQRLTRVLGIGVIGLVAASVAAGVLRLQMNDLVLGAFAVPILITWILLIGWRVSKINGEPFRTTIARANRAANEDAIENIRSFPRRLDPRGWRRRRNQTDETPAAERP